MSFGDTFVASAKGTHAFAKRQVYVNTYAFFGITFVKGTDKAFFPYLAGKPTVVPIRNGRVARISGAGDVIFLQY